MEEFGDESCIACSELGELFIRSDISQLLVLLHILSSLDIPFLDLPFFDLYISCSATLPQIGQVEFLGCKVVGQLP